MYRASPYTEGPNDSGTYTAGIDMQFQRYPGYGTAEWWLSRMEFHAKSASEAEYLRDAVLQKLAG